MERRDYFFKNKEFGDMTVQERQINKVKRKYKQISLKKTSINQKPPQSNNVKM